MLRGALAGALGGLAMKAFVEFVDPGSFGLSARTDADSAHELWRRLGWPPLRDRQAKQIGATLHYAFSVLTGATYWAAVRKYPILQRGRGLLFGTALWLFGDEVAVSASGLADPRRTPLPSHLSALAAHLIYMAVVDAICATGRQKAEQGSRASEALS